MTNIESLVTETEALCRAVAPRDLEGLPLYVVAQSSIAHEWGEAIGTCGFTMKGLDLQLKHLIPNYRGRGPAMVLNDLYTWSDDPLDLEYCFTMTALHELSHIAEREFPFDPREPKPLDIPPTDGLIEWLNKTPPVSEVISVFHHGPRFVRAVIHLAYRASRLGVRTSPAAVTNDWRANGMSGPWTYELALDDEPERRSDDLLSDILASDPPAEFTAVWKCDQRRIMDWKERMQKELQARTQQAA
jgi:hypothetical protein